MNLWATADTSVPIGRQSHPQEHTASWHFAVSTASPMHIAAALGLSFEGSGCLAVEGQREPVVSQPATPVGNRTAERSTCIHLSPQVPVLRTQNGVQSRWSGARSL